MPVYASSLMELARHYLGTAGAPASLREVLAERLTDPRRPRRPRRIRHSLGSLVSVLVAGVACGHSGPLAIAQAAAGLDQEVLAARGCRVSPATGQRIPPPAATVGRLPALLDADEVEAALPAWAASAALDPQVAAAAAERRRRERQDKQKGGRRRRRPPAAEALREARAGGQVRAAPGHPWLAAAVAGGPGHVPARPAFAVDGKERKLAKAGGRKKVHLLAAVTHVPGIVIGQDKVAKSGKANEVTHFRPLLEPLPLQDVLVTADAMQTTRDNARWLTGHKHARYLAPVLGNQPGLYAALDALPWEDTPVAAATVDTARGPIETRTVRVLPVPEGLDYPYAQQAMLIERYVTARKNGCWVMRNCEAVLYLTSPAAEDASPGDLLAHVRGHWRVEHLHWLRSPGVPSVYRDVASGASRRAFATRLRGCGARCRCCSDARCRRTGCFVQQLWRDYPILINR